MDAKTSPQLKMFYKLGITMTILPYLSKYYDEWADFMWNLCNPSRVTWYKFEMAFLCKFMDSDYDYDDELTFLLKQEIIDNSPVLDEKYCLDLKPSTGSRNVRNFLALAKTNRFKSLKSLKFTSMELLDVIGTRYANKFLKFATPKLIDDIYLEAKNGFLKTYIDSFSYLAPRVHGKILFSKFIIQKKELTKVRTSPHNRNIYNIHFF